MFACSSIAYLNITLGINMRMFNSSVSSVVIVVWIAVKVCPEPNSASPLFGLNSAVPHHDLSRLNTCKEYSKYDSARVTRTNVKS